MHAKNRRMWCCFAICVIASVSIWGGYAKLQDYNDISERRGRFWSMASSMYEFLSVYGHLPVDIANERKNADSGMSCAGGNSWRLSMVPYLFQDLPVVPNTPWYCEGLEQVRCRNVTYFHGEGSRWSIVNCVFPGGPGARRDDRNVEFANRRRLLLVESYPEETFWMETGDIDLLNLLNDRSLTDALQLRKANRESFMAMFSDLSCSEIKCTIPPTYIVAWIRGDTLSAADEKVAKQFIVWSKPVL